jgi:hypothetical protein
MRQHSGKRVEWMIDLDPSRVDSRAAVAGGQHVRLRCRYGQLLLANRAVLIILPINHSPACTSTTPGRGLLPPAAADADRIVMSRQCDALHTAHPAISIGWLFGSGRCDLCALASKWPPLLSVGCCYLLILSPQYLLFSNTEWGY